MKENRYLFKGDFKGMSGIILESRGGAKASNVQRNPDYKLLRHYILELLQSNKEGNVEIYVASNRESLYPTLLSRKISIDGIDQFDFSKCDILDFEKKLNEAVKKAGQKGTVSGGNDTKRLFFHIDNTNNILRTIPKVPNSIESEYLSLDDLNNALNNFKYSFIRIQKNSKELKAIVNDLQDKLYNYLSEIYTSFSWKKEFKMSMDRLDSFDIYAYNKKNNQHIVIELDPHRADSIAKKFVSRLAIMKQHHLIYLAFLYPGTDKMPINEAKKYLNDCEILSELMSTNDSRKEFLGFIM